MEDADSLGRMFYALVAQPVEAVSHQVQPTGSNWGLDLLVLLILVLINGFFSASEFSLVSMNQNKVRKMADEGSESAKRLLKLVSNPSGFLATIQVGVTFAGFLSSALASDRFAIRLQQWIDPLGRLPWVRSVSMVLITLLLSYFSLVLGELVPKRLALQNPEKMARGIAGIIHLFNRLMTPFTKLLAVSTNLVLRLLGVDPEFSEAAATEEEIRMMLDASGEKGNIQSTEKEMIDNIFEFNDKEVSEIMTHRTNVVALPLEATLEETIALCCGEKYSRIPVYDENIDDIVGILHIKDVLLYLAKQQEQPFKLKDHLRQPYVTPETKTIDALFREMQRDRVQLAVVIDEYGGTAGLVTLEDLLEEIVGNIQDEYDEEEAEIVQETPTTFLVDGMTDPEDVAKRIDCFPKDFEEEDVDTLAGYVIHLLDRIPEETEYPEVTSGRLKFQVVEMEEKRIAKIRIEVLPLSLSEQGIQEETQQVAEPDPEG